MFRLAVCGSLGLEFRLELGLGLWLGLGLTLTQTLTLTITNRRRTIVTNQRRESQPYPAGFSVRPDVLTRCSTVGRGRGLAGRRGGDDDDDDEGDLKH